MDVRSVLFLPANRPKLAEKIAAIGPDVAVLDLEDAVRPAEKDQAREIAVTSLAGLDTGNTRMFVRVNPPNSAWFSADLGALAGLDVGVVVPKYENPDTLETVRARIGDVPVVVGLETAHGVANARDLLTADVDHTYFGAEDYIADLGGRRTPGGLEVLAARSQVVLAARLGGVGSIDQAVVDVRDEKVFATDANAGRALGYSGKICLHPTQVALAHQIFSPTPEEVAHAERVVAAVESDSGVAVIDSMMVDEVHLRAARAILARATRGL